MLTLKTPYPPGFPNFGKPVVTVQTNKIKKKKKKKYLFLSV